MKKRKKIVLIYLYTVLAFLLFVNMLNFLSQVKDLVYIRQEFNKSNEFKKIRVLINNKSCVGNDKTTQEGALPKECTYYYKSPLDSFIVRSDANYLFKSSSVLSNCEKIEGILLKSNDSINVWHHPYLKDKIAWNWKKDFKDTLNWKSICMKLTLFTINVLTLIFIIVYFYSKRRSHED